MKISRWIIRVVRADNTERAFTVAATVEKHARRLAAGRLKGSERIVAVEAARGKKT